jgi:Zn-dependent protease with chaperone function
VALALIACAVLVFSCYYWVLPYCADLIAQRLPPMVGESLSAQVLKILDGGVLQPSALSAPRRHALNDALHGLTLPGGGRPTSVLLFRRSPQLGANAFTLPDGTIVVLDDLVTTIGSDPQILAVFAHELGHAQARHSLQLLLRGTVVGGFLALYLGDVSQLLAAAPTALLQARFSQDFERQADDYAAAVLVRNGMSPGLLADALEKLARQHPERAGGGYLASHPATAERIRRLRDLAAAQ